MDARYLQTRFEGRNIFSFVDPDFRALDRLRQLLISMKAVLLTDEMRRTLGVQRTLRGDLDLVLARLNTLLKEDNIELSQDNQVNADYEVRASNIVANALHVNTRLFYPGQGGNVFYGRLVQRVGANDYILWYGDYSSMFSVRH